MEIVPHSGPARHCDSSRNFAWRDKCHQCGRFEGGRPAARRDSERTAVWVSTRAMCGVRVGESEGGQGGAVPGRKAGRYGGGDTERIGAFSSYLRHTEAIGGPRCDDLGAELGSRSRDSGHRQQASGAARGVGVAASRSQTIASPAQDSIGGPGQGQQEVRTLSSRKSTISSSCSPLKKADLQEATTVAAEAQSEYPRLAAAAASGSPSLQNMAAQQQAAAIQLVGLLPATGSSFVPKFGGSRYCRMGVVPRRNCCRKTQSCSHQLPSRCHRETRTHREALREQQHRTPLRLFGRPRGTASNHTRQGSEQRSELTAAQLRASHGLWDPRACPEFNRIAQAKRLEQSVLDAWDSWEWIPDSARIVGIVCYTDGSADLNIACPLSGWGFVVLAVAQVEDRIISGLDRRGVQRSRVRPDAP